MSLVTVLFPYQINFRPFKTSQSQTAKQLCQFIGMINFYRNMCKKRSELLSPLTSLTSKNVKYECKYEHQKCFDAIKRVIGRELLLAYPDFNDPFEINTDASKLQISAVISQKGKSIPFYSRKMGSAQHKYTTTEKELLSIVAYLKDFCNILWDTRLQSIIIIKI